MSIKKVLLILLLLIGVNISLAAAFVLTKANADSEVSAKNKATFLPATPEKLQEFAQKIVAQCSTASYKPICYEKEVPLLMKTISMEDSFKVTSLIQEQDPSYTYCHVLGHELSAREVDKDPSKWKEVLSRCPSGVCSNGCIHGGFQERFRKELGDPNLVEKYKKDLETICEKRSDWNPTGLEQASCYHALGHLTMYATAGNVDTSLRLCDDISLKNDGRDFRHVCYDGVFMQIYQPLEAEDFALIKGKEQTAESVGAFCKKYPGMEEGSCVSESWPLFRNEILTPQGLTNHCLKLTDPFEQNRCYMGLFYVIPTQINFDSNKILAICNGLSGTLKDSCFAHSAGRFIETDYRNINKSIEFCQKASTESAQNSCYEQLKEFATYNFHPGSTESKHLCNMLPQTYQTNCGKQ